MSAILWPGFGVASFRWRQTEQQIAFKSIFGSQALAIGSPIWQVDIVGTAEKWQRAREIEAFMESLGGFKNQVELWNLKQPFPAGTYRGAIVLAANVAAGATTLPLDAGSGQANKTLLKGDLIGIGSGMTQQVMRVAQDAVADGSGVMSVMISAPLRNAFLSGQSVEWNRPKALFRQVGLNEGIQHVQGMSQPWSLSLIEDWRP